jgi:hypothetical protein
MITTSVDFLHAQRLPYELKHLLFKYVHDNIMQQLEKNTMSVHHEIESLYLLMALSKTGREYWLPEEVLLKHFLITKNKNTGQYSRANFMNHFLITTLLSYIKDKKRYTNLKIFIEDRMIAKLNYIKSHCPNDAEAMIMFLDLIVCPYISLETKNAIANIFGLDSVKLASIQAVNDYWFTAWGENFNLGRELDAKRSREVY